jgi:hypothetical protein
MIYFYASSTIPTTALEFAAAVERAEGGEAMRSGSTAAGSASASHQRPGPPAANVLGPAVEASLEMQDKAKAGPAAANVLGPAVEASLEMQDKAKAGAAADGGGDRQKTALRKGDTSDMRDARRKRE